MTRILTILLLAFSLACLGQSCDTYDGVAVNCIDSVGLKQGLWIYKKNRLTSSSYADLGSDAGCRYNAHYSPIAEIRGYFKDDMRIGQWEYLYGGHTLSLDRVENYYNNGDIKAEYWDYATTKSGRLVDHYYLTFNNDSSKIRGKFYHEFDSLTLSLEHDVCEIDFSNNDSLMTFRNCDLDKFEYEILRLLIGVYDRDIKIKKDAR
ncbi:hypothetical protein O3Q51_08865 [Cryomorphaceae bacterium 1068]|nr:hypothetical protein [Cryomorphaceae bacterium 1068]